MRGPARVGVVIFAQRSAEILPDLVREAPAWIDDLLVVGDAATDPSLRAAARAGARVVDTRSQPIGLALRNGIARLRPCDVVVLAGGHGHDDLRELPRLVDPIVAGAAELVLGAHDPATLNGSGPGAAARVVDWFVAKSLRWVWGARLSEAGTFRAIRRDLLTRLEMRHVDQRWMIEMIVRVLRRRSRILEMPIGYRHTFGGVALNGVHDVGLVDRGRALHTVLDAALRRREWRDARLRTLRPRIVLLTEYPRAGHVKTRFIANLGNEAATMLHDTLTRHTIGAIAPAIESGKAELEVRFHGGDEALMRAWLGRDRLYCPQGDGSVAARMRRATTEALAGGADAVCLVVDDCPQLSATHIRLALDRLQTADIVVGPTPDGGNYLLAIRAAHGGLFDEPLWEGRDIARTLGHYASARRLTVHHLEPLARVENVADLELLPDRVAQAPFFPQASSGYRQIPAPTIPIDSDTSKRR